MKKVVLGLFLVLKMPSSRQNFIVIVLLLSLIGAACYSISFVSLGHAIPNRLAHVDILQMDTKDIFYVHFDEPKKIYVIILDTQTNAPYMIEYPWDAQLAKAVFKKMTSPEETQLPDKDTSE